MTYNAGTRRWKSPLTNTVGFLFNRASDFKRVIPPDIDAEQWNGPKLTILLPAFVPNSLVHVPAGQKKWKLPGNLLWQLCSPRIKYVNGIFKIYLPV